MIKYFFRFILLFCLSLCSFYLFNWSWVNFSTLSNDISISQTSLVGSNQSCSVSESQIAENTCSESIPSGCSVFTVSKGDQVFFGGNDDYINPDQYYWVDPGDEKNYGAIWIGYPDNVQQGVNEKGLAYDANGLPRVDVNPHLERERVVGDYSSYPIHILHECATVEEVINWVITHQWHAYMHDQMHFADASGDGVIISAGIDGEVVFTRKPPGDSYLVSTNFNVANPANGYGCCSRFDTMNEILEHKVSQTGILTVQDAADVLEAVHMDGGASWTIESMVADLTNGKVYLYYFHQFDSPIVLNVAEEIEGGREAGPLSKLFPVEVQKEAERRYQQIQAKKGYSLTTGKAWIGLVAASLVFLLLLSFRKRGGWKFWIPLTAILGPLGLLTWFVAGPNRQGKAWKAAIVEAAGDVMPTVLAFMVYLYLGIFIPSIQASESSQVLLIFGLPVIVGWLFVQGPVMGFTNKGDFLSSFFRRLPHTWLTALFAMTSAMCISSTLVVLTIELPVQIWHVFAWWAFTVLSALPGMLMLMPYEIWALHRGNQAWSILAGREGKVSTLSWKRLWWWVLLSMLVLVSGIVGYVYLQQFL